MSADARRGSRRRHPTPSKPRARSADAAALTTPTSTTGGRAPWWMAAAIAIAIIATYAGGFSHPFIFDDQGAIVHNSTIEHLARPAVWIVPPVESPVGGRPLVNLSFALNHALGGLDVSGYHVVNAAIHVACAWLLFGLVRRALRLGAAGAVFGARADGIALAIALLWAVHPLTSEPVNYLTQRTESLMALAYLATLYASVRASERTDRRWTIAAIAACAAGMACKESMVTAPLMVVLFDRMFLFDSLAAAWQRRRGLYSGQAATWIVLAVLLAQHARTSSAGFMTAPTSVWIYLLNQTVIVTRYLRLVIWPIGLVLYYGWPRPLTLEDVWPYVLVLVAIAAVAGVVSRRWPRVAFLVAWVVITLAPSSSLVPIGSEAGAERRMYLPLMALVTMAVLGVIALWDGWAQQPRRAASRASGRVAAVLAAAGLAILLGATTAARTTEYSSALTMAQTVADRWPGSGAEYLLGTELAAAGRHDEAIAHLRLAADGVPPARFNLGSELFNVGQRDEAVAELQRFVREEPRLGAVVDARLIIGRAEAAAGQWPAAIDAFTKAAESAPSNADAQGLLADALASTQAFDAAVVHYRRFLDARPGDAGAWTGLGIALAASGHAGDAADAFGRAAAIDPADEHFQVNLARALMDAGRAAAAVAPAERAVTLAPADTAAFEVLGRAYEAVGRRDDARAAYSRAIALDSTNAAARDGLKRIKD